jgi:hypothetical protein
VPDGKVYSIAESNAGSADRALMRCCHTNLLVRQNEFTVTQYSISRRN